MRGLGKIISGIPEALLVFLLASMLAGVNLQVIFRYFLNSPLDWSEEISRLFLIWMTFIGSAVAVKRREHLMVEMFINKFPDRLRTLWLRGISIVSMGILLMIIIASFELLEMTLLQPSAVLGFSTSLFFLSLPVGASLMIIYMLRQLLGKDRG